MLTLKPLDLLLFVLIMAIWGFNFAVVKIGLESMPPLLFIALRFMVVAVVLLPLVKPPKGRWLEMLALSFTLGFLHFAFMFSALGNIDAATAAIAIQLQVPFAALMAAVLFKDMLGWRRALGMAVAFGGVALIAGEPRLDGHYLALFTVIAAACIWAVANVQVKRMTEIDGMTINAYVGLFSVPQLLLASFIWEEGQWQALQSINGFVIFAVLYQSLAVVVFGYGLWYRLLKTHDVNQAMPMTLLVPIFGVLSGILFLGEVLTLPLMIGGLLTVIGVGIIVIRRPRQVDPKVDRI